MENTTPKVYSAISAVSAALAENGIPKSRRNEQQGFRFRGIDDLYAALAPLLVQHHLIILPRYLSRMVSEQTTRNNGLLFHVTLEAEFDLVHTIDQSKHTVRAFGEAMDSADKATGKAMSAAYKTMCFQLFCIPTEGDNDPDATSFRVAAQSVTHQSVTHQSATQPRRFQQPPQTVSGGSTPQPAPSRPAPPQTPPVRQPGNAPQKVSEGPMTPEEAEEAEAEINQAFEERGIPTNRARSIKIGLLQAMKKAHVQNAGRGFVDRLIQSIRSGKYDGQNGRVNGAAHAVAGV